MGILCENDTTKGTEAGSIFAPGGTAATLHAVLTQPPGPLAQLDVSSPPGSEPAKMAIDNALKLLGIPWQSVNQVPPSVIVAAGGLQSLSAQMANVTDTAIERADPNYTQPALR